MGNSEGPGGGKARSNLALRVGLAGALGVGALITGFILTRPGRKLVGDVLAGRKRTHLEGRVLDAFWADRVLGRRKLDVQEAGPGRVVLTGTVESLEDVGRAVALAERAKGVKEVESRITVADGARPPR